VFYWQYRQLINLEVNTVFETFPELSTERLLLRRLVLSDREQLLQLRSDEQVNKYLDRPKSTTTEECIAFVHKIDDQLKTGCYYWVISLKTDKVLMGTICLWNFETEKGTADLGYELSPAHHGKGIMLEAVKSVVDFGFNVIGLKVILALTHPQNEASRRLLKRAGFEEDLNYGYVSKDDAGEEAVYFLVR
jgi:ribosomal-protein-alanine N-acetyltransferase